MLIGDDEGMAISARIKKRFKLKMVAILYQLFKTEDGEIIMAVSVSQKVQFMVWAVFVWDEKCRL